MSGTAVIHPSTLTPGKLELLAPWLPEQDWFTGDVTALDRVGAFRFVDPDGEVGVETMVISAGDGLYHVPVTYRGAPLEGADDRLIGTLEHSVLGTRWVYDATCDPVYLAELVRVIREGDTEADLDRDGQAMPKTATAVGSGVDAVADATGMVRIVRKIDDDPHFSTHHARGLLTARVSVDNQPREFVVAALR